MCQWGITETVRVLIPADLASDGVEKWKAAEIDACIAPLVRALQQGGINMRGSCCGHGKVLGHIDLADGGGLVILSKEQNACWLRDISAQNAWHILWDLTTDPAKGERRSRISSLAVDTG